MGREFDFDTGPAATPAYLPSRRRNGRYLLLTCVIVAAILGGAAFVVFRVMEPHKHHRQRLIEAHLRQYANDPDSVSVQRVRYGPVTNEKGQTEQMTLVEARGRNGLGAIVLSRYALKIINDRDVITPWDAEAVEKGWVDMEWSDDPNGPPTPRRPAPRR